MTEPALPTDGATMPRSDGLPHREAPASSSERPPLELARRIVELAEDKKAADIVLLDLTGLTTLADAFVICSGGSERQLDAIADGVIEGLRAEKVRPIGREGTPAHDIRFEGLVFAHTEWQPPADYASSLQGGIEVPGALLFDYAERCAFTDGAIEHIGNYGVEVNVGCSDIEIARAEMPASYVDYREQAG